MRQRPWPIFALAILQFLTPLIYVSFFAGFYKLSLRSASQELVELNTSLRLFEIFFLPLLLGALILLARKLSYYLVLLGCMYQLARGVLVFIASNQTDPVFPMMIANLFCLGAIIYLIVSRSRDLFLNPRLRWWEHRPRYIVDFPATIVRVGAAPMSSKLINIANGGAGVEIPASGFLQGELIDLEFRAGQGATYQMKSRIVWEKTNPEGGQTLGLQWAETSLNSDRSQLRRLIRELKTRKTPTTRPTGPWWDGVVHRIFG